MSAAQLLIAACDDPGAVADRLREQGMEVVRVLGFLSELCLNFFRFIAEIFELFEL